jgi:anaerobic selenocysteine-containing dehydrogenase
MGGVKKIKTVCRNCHGACGVIAQVEDGKVIKVEGDPDSPISRGTMCTKGLAVTQLAYHPDRIIHPMKKANGKWERIAWDQALETIANKFQAVIDEYGPE